MAPAATSRLAMVFAELRGRGERALVAYLTAGDPSLAETRRLVREAAARGADIVELGVPFSDPIADGPVIQRAAMRALARGTSVARVLETVATLRAETAVPLVLLTYYNPVLAFGLKAFARTAADAGVDGVIVADLPPEEAGPFAAEAEAAGLDLVHLVAPTSTPPRVRLIARRSRGFIYVVSLTGVTGERRELPPDLEAQIRALRRVTTKPVCDGSEGTASRVHIAEGLWIKCDSCKEIVYRAEVERAGRVCPKCHYPFRVSARERVALLADPGTFEERDSHLESTDPLGFKDTKK